METQGLNLFIVDDNKLFESTLEKYLQKRFGLGINIFMFNDESSCLKEIGEKTDVVILDYYMPNKSALKTLKSIKSINPKTEVIMLSSNKNIGLAVEMHQQGARDYIVKGPKSLSKIIYILNFIITAPIRLLVREFKVSKFVAIFLLTFILMGIIVVSVLRGMNWN